MTKVAADSLPGGQKLRNFNLTCIVHKSRIASEYCFVLVFRHRGARGRIFNSMPRERKAEFSIGLGEEETLEALQVKRHQYRARTSAAGVCVRLHPDVPAPSAAPGQARRAAPCEAPPPLTCMMPPPPCRRRCRPRTLPHTLILPLFPSFTSPFFFSTLLTLAHDAFFLFT